MENSDASSETILIKSNSIRLSVTVPKDLDKKISYIKSKTFLSKKQIVMMSASPTLEAWCKKLMDEELAIRTGKAKIELPQPVPIPERMPINPAINLKEINFNLPFKNS